MPIAPEALAEAARRSYALRMAKQLAQAPQQQSSPVGPKGDLLNTHPYAKQVAQHPLAGPVDHTFADDGVAPTQAPQGVDTSYAQSFLKGPSVGFGPEDDSGFMSPAMQAGGGPQDITPSGFDAPQDDETPQGKGPTSGSFWNNPAATDSLLAFGGAMLQAPNFNAGLGAGAQAVQASMQNHAMPNAAEMARMAMKTNQLKELASLKGSSGGGTTISMGAQGIENGYDDEGHSIPRYYDKNLDSIVYVNPDGTKTREKPAGWVRDSDSEVGRQSAQNIKNMEKFQEGVGLARKELGQIDAMEQKFVRAGGGPGVLKAAARNIASLLGTDIPGYVDLADRDTIDMFLTSKELIEARGQRGLGQLTEGERKIIRRSLPAMHTSEEAFMDMMQVFREAQQRKINTYSDWQEMSPAERRAYKGDINAYELSVLDEINKQSRKTQGEGGNENTTKSGVKWKVY